jgi:hypothetical protein
MGCGCGKRGNRAKKKPTENGKKARSTKEVIKELWNKSQQVKKKTTVKKINKKR